MSWLACMAVSGTGFLGFCDIAIDLSSSRIESRVRAFFKPLYVQSNSNNLIGWTFTQQHKNTLPVQPKLLTEKVSALPSQSLVLNSVHFTSLKKRLRPRHCDKYPLKAAEEKISKMYLCQSVPYILFSLYQRAVL